MSYSIDLLTADCYPGTSCLINKLDIRDEEMLAEYEAMVTTAKVALLEQNPLPGNFSRQDAVLCGVGRDQLFLHSTIQGVGHEEVHIPHRFGREAGRLLFRLFSLNSARVSHAIEEELHVVIGELLRAISRAAPSLRVPASPPRARP